MSDWQMLLILPLVFAAVCGICLLESCLSMLGLGVRRVFISQEEDEKRAKEIADKESQKDKPQ